MYKSIMPTCKRMIKQVDKYRFIRSNLDKGKDL